jgi:hypothetical protein
MIQSKKPQNNIMTAPNLDFSGSNNNEFAAPPHLHKLHKPAKYNSAGLIEKIKVAHSQDKYPSPRMVRHKYPSPRIDASADVEVLSRTRRKRT